MSYGIAEGGGRVRRDERRGDIEADGDKGDDNL